MCPVTQTNINSVGREQGDKPGIKRRTKQVEYSFITCRIDEIQALYSKNKSG